MVQCGHKGIRPSLIWLKVMYRVELFFINGALVQQKGDVVMSTPLHLANNFIQKALQEDISLSPMKLQKLIYFTYRDYLQGTGDKLFIDPFCVWKYGPVVEVVYSHFKPFGANSINRFYRDSNDSVHIIDESVINFGATLNAVWNNYRHLSGIDLSKITHREGTAWYKAWTTHVPFLNNEDIKNEHVE